MTVGPIAVIGAGAWGTALANVVARGGRGVTLWARDAAAAHRLAASRRSPHLPRVDLDERVAVRSLSETLPENAVMLLAIPAQSLREVVLRLAEVPRPGATMIACAKGIERGTRRFMTEIIAECLPGAVPAILSGPSFADDVARGLPTAVTLATRDESHGRDLAGLFGLATFRPYHSTDVRGVEIGGAAKNVLAIAAGIVAGRNFGASAAAALTTRGFAELVRFGKVFGARPGTLTGLSGLGDLILTCASPQSRNFSLGVALGRGTATGIAGKAAPLAEGAFTAAVLVEMARERGVEMPIAEAVAAVLEGALEIDAAIEALLARPLRAEA